MRTIHTVINGFMIAFILPFSLSAQVSIVGELSQDKDVKPGSEYSGSVVIRNDTNEPQEAKVYQTDYSFQWNGSNNYGDPGTLPRSNAKWITFSPSFVTLPPLGTVTVNYTLTIPKDTVISGTYWSMLMVEGVPRLSLIHI